jgi:hypothetical protein
MRNISKINTAPNIYLQLRAFKVANKFKLPKQQMILMPAYSNLANI